MDLEQVILEYINEIYNIEYIGKLKVSKINPIGYKIDFGFNTPYQPLVIYIELEGDLFLKELKKELKNMNLGRVFYGKLDKVMPPECTQTNRACSCNDK